MHGVRVGILTIVAAWPVFAQPAADTAAKPATQAPFSEKVPVAAAKIDLVPVPGSKDGSVKPFYMSTTEIVWEVFDVFAYRLDVEAGDTGAAADATTRPSKPYLPPDRGFGHEGYAAICVSYANAQEFCRWLSKKTGRTYRLPAEAEWQHACLAGATTAFAFGDEEAKAGEHAWFAGNSDATPHPVGTKAANAWGLFDMHGNVQEWCVGPDGKGVTKGGSYRDDTARLKAAARQPQERSWNASDPQMPKSTWWLSDGPFVGFRVVCEMPASPAGSTTGSGESK